MNELKVHDTVIPFVCENPDCGKEYDLEGFRNVAILWGFIYLTNGEHDLIGFTCPECRKTTLRKYISKSSDYLISQLEEFETREDGLVVPSFRRFVFRQFVPFCMKMLEDLGLENLPDLKIFNEEKPYKIPFGINPATYYPHAIIKESTQAITEGSIPDLLMVENVEGFKTLPRVVRNMSDYENFDVCLGEFDFDDTIPDNVMAAINLSLSVKITISYSMKYDESCAKNKIHYDHMIENDLNLDEYKDTYCLHDDSHWERKVFRDNVGNFINEYRLLRNRINFELIFINTLVHKYGRIIYYPPGFSDQQGFDDISEVDIPEMGENPLVDGHTLYGVPPEKRFGFFEEGSSYRLVFKKKEFTGLKMDGFKYLYHLVTNKGKAFTHLNLYNIFKKPHSSTKPDELDISIGDESSVQKGHHDFDRVIDRELEFVIADHKTIRDIESELENQRGIAERAKVAGDPILEKKARDEILRIEFHIKEYEEGKNQLKKGGEKRGGKGKKIDTVGNAIRRALRELKDPDVAKHFKRSCGGYHQSTIKYDPNPDIEWITELQK